MGQRKERILVVNDEPVVLAFACAVLTRAGYQCRQATNGLEALAVLDSAKEIDLLLSNLMMPELDGLELLTRTNERFPDMPFVLESGCHDLSVFLTALRMGAYDYLKTPFEGEHLLALVRRALEYRRLKLENRKLRDKLAKMRSKR